MPPPPSPSSNRLTEGPIARTLLAFALPTLGANVLQSLNGSVNAVWVGRYLGEAALTATTNANLILFFLLGVVFGISLATTILVGQSVGARDIEQARRVAGTGATFFAAIALLVSVLGYIGAPALLRAMGTPADALPFATAYLRIIFIALPPMYFYTFLMMTLRGSGDARTPFYFMLLSVVLDIGLNPLLIFGIGPFPAMGIAGSATATLIAQSIALAGLVTWIYRRKHFLALGRHEMHYLRPNGAILRAMVGKGLPMGMQMVVFSSSAILMIALVNALGSQTTAAYGAAAQLWTYIQMPALAIGAAVSSMVAQNIGARRWDRVGRIALAGGGFNLVLTGSLVAVVYLFNATALRLFLHEDSAAVAIGQHINAIAVWAFLFFGITIVLFSVVRASGAVYAPLVILIVSMWLVRYPFARLLEPAWGADAIWWSFPVSSLVSVVAAGIYYRYGGWRQARMLGKAPPMPQPPSTAAATPAEPEISSASPPAGGDAPAARRAVHGEPP